MWLSLYSEWAYKIYFNREIEALLQSETYIIIKETDNLDAYFDELKESLMV